MYSNTFEEIIRRVQAVERPLMVHVSMLVQGWQEDSPPGSTAQPSSEFGD